MLGAGMGKSHPMELRSRVIAFVEDGLGHRGEPSTRHWSERDGERPALPGFAAFCERHGDPEARKRGAFAKDAGQPCRGQAGPLQRLATGSAGGQRRSDTGRDRGGDGRRARRDGASRIGRQMAAPAWPQP